MCGLPNRYIINCFYTSHHQNWRDEPGIVNRISSRNFKIICLSIRVGKNKFTEISERIMRMRLLHWISLILDAKIELFKCHLNQGGESFALAAASWATSPVTPGLKARMHLFFVIMSVVGIILKPSSSIGSSKDCRKNQTHAYGWRSGIT